jgi:hypothetical protein
VTVCCAAGAAFSCSSCFNVGLPDRLFPCFIFKEGSATGQDHMYHTDKASLIETWYKFLILFSTCDQQVVWFCCPPRT